MSNTLKAGFSRVDITPPLGIGISGYYVERHAAGVLDPLEANALAVGCGAEEGGVQIPSLIPLLRGQSGQGDLREKSALRGEEPEPVDAEERDPLPVYRRNRSLYRRRTPIPDRTGARETTAP